MHNVKNNIILSFVYKKQFYIVYYFFLSYIYNVLFIIYDKDIFNILIQLDIFLKVLEDGFQMLSKLYG